MDFRSNFFRTFWLGIIVLFTSQFSFSQIQEEVAILRMRAHLLDIEESDDFSGVVLVASKGEILFKEGYGWADRQENISNTPETRFMIASLSKSFTAACILKCEEEGLLEVTDPIGNYLENYPEWAGKNISIHHLLTHTSGIPDYMNDFPVGFWLKRKFGWKPNREKLVNSFKNKSLLFYPGREFSYSNSGYVLLASIVEKASGTKFGQFLQDKVLDPLQLSNTGCGNFNEISNSAIAYGGKPDDLHPLENFCEEITFGMGGLYSTVEDLYHWVSSISDTLVLNSVERDKMFKPEKRAYAYGWEVRPESGRRSFSHSGYFPGWSSFLKYFPEDGFCVVVITNSDYSDPFEVVDDLNECWNLNTIKSDSFFLQEDSILNFPLEGKWALDLKYPWEDGDSEDLFHQKEIQIYWDSLEGSWIFCSEGMEEKIRLELSPDGVWKLRDKYIVSFYLSSGTLGMQITSGESGDYMFDWIKEK